MQDKHTLSHSQGLTRGPYTFSWLKRTCRNPLFQVLSGNIPVRIQVFSSRSTKGLQVLPRPQLKREDQMENTQFNILHHLVPFICCASAPGLSPGLSYGSIPQSCPAVTHTHPTVHTTARSKQQALVSHQPLRPSLCWLFTTHYFTPSILTYLRSVHGITDGTWPQIQQT